MPSSEIQHGLRRVARLLPPDTRRSVRRSGGAFLRQLPKPIAQEIRGLFGVRWQVTPKPNRVAGRGAQDRSSGRPTPGRGAAAAATAAVDAGMSEKLERLLGREDLGRTAGGSRTVVGLVAPDARALLEGQGHRVVALAPGTSVAVAKRADVLLLDLDAFTGVWAGALTTSGVALLLELLAALGAAFQEGATCWLLVRGEHRTEIGALLLRRQSMLMPIHPGRPRQSAHYTEDPGDAPLEIADLLSTLEEPARD